MIVAVTTAQNRVRFTNVTNAAHTAIGRPKSSFAKKLIAAMTTAAIASLLSRTGSIDAAASVHRATRPGSADVTFVTSPRYLVQSMTSANSNASAPAATKPIVGSGRP